ncbi:hypothetical protein [Aeromicrobium sp. Leaf291]|uniref:hypothetical protein n=1 Tax=Aeromicrobium sp. Leaf291 TaxID=1736325 RepID=UPI0006F53744|nr:hypothetical protein [Aeromicrobium sp. Leaf291]KQP83724.1 hypothetical protein ASF35_01735 [Aeromicrobium sp. Leaf291]
MNTDTEDELVALALGDNYHDNDCESGEIRFYCKCRERGAGRVLGYLAPVRSAEQEKAAEEARQHAECDRFKEQYHEQWMLNVRECERLQAQLDAVLAVLDESTVQYGAIGNRSTALVRVDRVRAALVDSGAV